MAEASGLSGHHKLCKLRGFEDQRRVGLCLTEEAAKLIMIAPGPAEGILPEALAGLSPDTIQMLDSSLREVIEQLQIKDDKLAENHLSDM